MISTRTSVRYVALIAGSALALSACATSGESDPADPQAGEGAAEETTEAGAENVTFTYAYEQEIDSYNSGTADTNASKNVIVLNQVVGGFSQYGPDGSIIPQPEFGTFEVTSEDPLTVEYSFAEGAVWSDGEPIDCDDAMLAWAARQPEFQGVPADEEAGTPAVPGFQSAGVTGYENQQQPQCEDGDTSFTVVYDEPFADYEIMYASGEIVPAHIVEQNSGVEDIIAPISAGDVAALAPAAEFWNTGFNFNPGEWDESVALSAGPYTVDNWQAGQSITLVRNDQWWGEPGQAEQIVIRFIPQDAQAQALQNGEIQAMDPQPSPDLLAQLEAIGSAVAVEPQDQYTYEHWDFNFEGAFADPNLRQAFALCIPRQTMIDNLIAPLNPDAEVLNSRYYFPFEEGYQEVVEASYAGQSEQDIEAARAILEEKGAVGTQLRLGHNNNARRAAEAALIIEACGPNGAGFDVIDAGDETFFDADGGLATRQFEVAQFAWAGSPLKSGSSSTFQTGGGNNNGAYSNPEVDALIDQLNVTIDPDEQQAIVTDIETILWNDLATIPGFSFPGVLATTEDAAGVEYNPTQAGLTWNANEWTRTDSAG